MKNKLLYMVIGDMVIVIIYIFIYYVIVKHSFILDLDTERQRIVIISINAMAIAILPFYFKLYDVLGFNKMITMSSGLLVSGYILTWVNFNGVIFFIGLLCTITGYLTVLLSLVAMITNNILKVNMESMIKFYIFSQFLVLGLLSTIVGIIVLQGETDVSNIYRTIFWRFNSIIYMVGFIVLLLFLIILNLIFMIIRKSHWKLTTDEIVDWSEYPRPQLKRKSFYNLNGRWQLNGFPIEVPFPPQSILSRYRQSVKSSLDYIRSFTLPQEFIKERVILHFGAVDQKAEIFINNKKIGFHEGGYLPFSIDVTDSIDKRGKNILMVRAKDDLLKRYPYGKQRKKRGGMWYTPVSGIWQTVWLESVPKIYISKIKITPSMSGIELEVETNGNEYEVFIDLEGDTYSFKAKERKIHIDLSKVKLKNGSRYTPILWTVENPYLYSIRIKAEDDEIESYFGLRTITIEKIEGINRICLNGKPIFLHGVLDQGYYCDGIFLPSSPKGFEKDILEMKAMGFNLLRKHLKVEPQWFYYYCDKHGLLVMQDMVNNGRYSFVRDTILPTIGMVKLKDKGKGTKRERDFFINHTKETIEHIYNHPSVIAYTIFNEGWGQFDSDYLYELAKKQDNTRFIDSTSGWFSQESSDVDSLHIYFKTIELPKTKRPLIVSECGGYSYEVPGHIYSKYNYYGYGNCDNIDKLTDKIVSMYENMIIPAITKGLCGCVYTQLSDVEDETNGLFTYDRKICKVHKDKMLKISLQIMSITRGN